MAELDMKEKLVELLLKMISPTITVGEQADFLIANGVGFVTDNNVGCKWIPVTDEQKPKNRRDYFVAYVFGDSDFRFFGGSKYYANSGNGLVDGPHFSGEGMDGMRVTHWMEIPKLPQPQKGE